MAPRPPARACALAPRDPRPRAREGAASLRGSGRTVPFPGQVESPQGIRPPQATACRPSTVRTARVENMGGRLAVAVQSSPRPSGPRGWPKPCDRATRSSPCSSESLRVRLPQNHGSRPSRRPALTPRPPLVSGQEQERPTVLPDSTRGGERGFGSHRPCSSLLFSPFRGESSLMVSLSNHALVLVGIRSETRGGRGVRRMRQSGRYPAPPPPVDGGHVRKTATGR